MVLKKQSFLESPESVYDLFLIHDEIVFHLVLKTSSFHVPRRLRWLGCFASIRYYQIRYLICVLCYPTLLLLALWSCLPSKQ